MKGVPAARPATHVDLAALRVPERTLELLRELIESRTGIHYDDGRLDVLCDRLSPLAIERGFDSLLDYYYLLKYDSDDVLEWPRVMDALSVQESYFWREADQLRALTDAIVPALAERGRAPIRIWSVPCAGGEEPLSIAMALDRAGWFDKLSIDILASDASTSALTRAQNRRYGGRAFRQLPVEWRNIYFTPAGNSSQWVVDDRLFSRIRSWTRVNIVDADASSPYEGCDVIFCRNLFIYFSQQTIRSIVERFARAMPSPAYLCVGTSESLLRLTSAFQLQDVGGAYVYVKS